MWSFISDDEIYITETQADPKRIADVESIKKRFNVMDARPQ